MTFFFLFIKLEKIKTEKKNFCEATELIFSSMTWKAKNSLLQCSCKLHNCKTISWYLLSDWTGTENDEEGLSGLHPTSKFFLGFFYGIGHILKLNIDPPAYAGCRYELFFYISNFIIFAVTRTLVTENSSCWIIRGSNLWFTLALKHHLKYVSSWLSNC